jgi:hypothetical protein
MRFDNGELRLQSNYYLRKIGNNGTSAGSTTCNVVLCHAITEHIGEDSELVVI